MTNCFFFIWYFFYGDTMKTKFLIIIFFLCSIFLIFTSFDEKEVVLENTKEKRGVFISYIELSKYLKEKSEEDGIGEIRRMVSNIEELGFTMILLQVRSFSDAIYPSDIFPWSATVSREEGISPGYDILKSFIDICDKEKIELYAWINPYRIRGDEDSSDISEDNPAYSYLNTEVVNINNGIFYNPASEEAREIIVEGVEELVQNYSLDAVIFDDYFYPNDTIDLEEYEKYQKVHSDVSIEEFRFLQVNELIQDVYQVCHQNDTLFGVSPDGNIENNYQKHYADVKTWGSKTEYVDFLMPQIYYGFYNETKAFVSVLNDWENLATKVELLPVLAFYKVGAVDNFAKSGSTEWMENDDIIMREVLLTRNLKQYQGFSLFRYDYLFNSELRTSTTMAELKNMKKILK